jgi:thiol:disulfide interchange protein
MVAIVRGLGYRVEPMDMLQKVEIRRNYPTLPEPISNAMMLARANKELVFVDFYASWCGPCKTLERQVLSTTVVERALAGFHSVKVDTDRFPEAANQFGVVGLPTLVVLNSQGVEVYRHLGPIQTVKLVNVLDDLRKRFGASTARN